MRRHRQQINIARKFSLRGACDENSLFITQINQPNSILGYFSLIAHVLRDFGVLKSHSSHSSSGTTLPSLPSHFFGSSFF